jgi:hypothetical protein
MSDRDLRLFACWCCRQVWHLLTDERSRHAVEVSERYAVGKATENELSAARAAARAAADAIRAADDDADADADADAARAAAYAAGDADASDAAARAAYADADADAACAAQSEQLKTYAVDFSRNAGGAR